MQKEMGKINKWSQHKKKLRNSFEVLGCVPFILLNNQQLLLNVTSAADQHCKTQERLPIFQSLLFMTGLTIILLQFIPSLKLLTFMTVLGNVDIPKDFATLALTC